MITSVKKFGSYVLEKNHLFDEDLNDVGNRVEEDTFQCSIPSVWTKLPLLEIRKYNHDTSIFRFALPEGTGRLNLPVGGYLLVLAPISEHDGTDAIRPYTSIADDDTVKLLEDNQTGTFDLLCKRYDEWGKKENPVTHFLFTKTDHSYRPPGSVSNYIHKLKPGDTLQFKCKSLIKLSSHV
jgi:hypothetical protein